MKIGVIMGSTSDLEVMQAAFDALTEFGVEFEKRVISAHRAPHLLCEWAESAADRGIGVIIAGAGGAAHLAGVTAAYTTLPVIGVPIYSKSFGGMDALLATVQMPSGIPVATVAVNGAKNAALLAIEILALQDADLRQKLKEFRQKQTSKIENTVI
ncbi:MAG: 5-(carboxyamino)imidazole ribonucleotide mutase [Bacteroidales bacterium]|nr:5-(carboxyamino)imidazole ribonucleotide mutase [Bacteroidales bacterium]MBR0054792.1 5-(carboxyamino)imidazole ribonucleotide mutase [Bacteroidales bacterium]